LDFLFKRAYPDSPFDRESDEYLNAFYIFEVVYENISKFAATGGIALLLGIGKYFLFFALIYGMLKYFSYGVHFDSSLRCLLVGALTYYGSIYLALYLGRFVIPEVIYFGVYVGCFVIYRLYAPAVSKMQYLRTDRKAKLKQHVQYFIVALFLVQFVFSDVYRNLMLLALVAEATNILPIAFYLIEGKEVKD